MENDDAGPLVRFYRGEKVHPAGCLVSEVWAWDHAQLEKRKDCIGWLFPADDRMQQRYAAPLLSFEDIKSFQSLQQLREGLLRSFAQVAGFYGFEMDGDLAAASLRPSWNHAERVSAWLSKFHRHNRRISQVLRSLSLLGCKEHAEAFLRELRKVYTANPGRIDYDVFKHWRYAAMNLNKPED
jgi:hypothetical protein